MKVRSRSGAGGRARSVSRAGPSRSSIRSARPASCQYRRATAVHSSLLSQQISRPPGASPPVNGFHIGAAFIHFYGLMYVIGITLAFIITRRRWAARGGNPALVAEVATWAVPAGIIGARIYFDLTTPADIPHHWWGVFAVWSGGLGVWGGIAAGTLVGAWRVRRAGASVTLFMDAIAPAPLVAQAGGRLGNYFHQELFGQP